MPGPEIQTPDPVHPAGDDTLTMTRDQFHQRLNRELAQLKDQWVEKGRSEVAKELDDLRKYKTDIEQRDLSELQKAQRAATDWQGKFAQQEQQLRSFRWRVAVGEALRQSTTAGTLVMPQFVGQMPELTGRETDEELFEKAKAGVQTAFESQMRELKAMGFSPQPQPLSASPGVAPVVPMPGPGYLTMPASPMPGQPPEQAGGLSETALQFLGMSKQGKRG